MVLWLCVECQLCIGGCEHIVIENGICGTWLARSRTIRDTTWCVIGSIRDDDVVSCLEYDACIADMFVEFVCCVVGKLLCGVGCVVVVVV